MKSTSSNMFQVWLKMHQKDWIVATFCEYIEYEKSRAIYSTILIFIFLQDKNQTEIQSVKKESEQSQKLFLQRLFPEVKAPKVTKSHSDWLEDFASQVNKYKDVNKQLKEASPVKAEVDQEQINKLEGQVQHYQSVLNATVSFETN